MTVAHDTAVPLWQRLGKLRLGGLVALALIAGAAAWFAGRPDGPRPAAAPISPSPSAATSRAPMPRLVSAAELGSVASRSAPVYWVGPRRDGAYELTQTSAGRVFVRYLTSPAQLGSPRPDFVAVATYAQPNAYAAIEAATRRRGAITIRPANGGLAVFDRARPTSVFLAYPGGNRQIEVYAPSAVMAQRLVRSGAVTAVPLPGVPRIVTGSELSRFAASRDTRIFWAGARAGGAIELTETSQGNVFVRYLRNAAQVGSPNAGFLVVATYRRTRAFAGLKAAARRSGAMTFRVRGGGMAVYDRAHPTSVYLAYPERDRQIEVYHPDQREARRLVRSGAIIAVP